MLKEQVEQMTSGSRLRERDSEVMSKASAEDKRKEHQRELAKKKQEEHLQLLEKGKKGLGSGATKKQSGDANSYESPSQFPSGTNLYNVWFTLYSLNLFLKLTNLIGLLTGDD